MAFTAAASSKEKPAITSSISANTASANGGTSTIFGSAANAFNQDNSTLTLALIRPYSEKTGRKASTDFA